jgi:hypothetical protein
MLFDRKITSVLSFVGILLLMYFRHPGQFIHPQFWVEGSYIYSYAYKGPILEYLIAPLYGYLMIPERLIVLIFTPLVPIEYHPHICVYVTLFLTMGMFLYFLHTPSRLPKIFLFVFAVFLSSSDGGEVFNKLLYLMWMLPLSLLFILFRDSSAVSRRVLIMDIIWIILAGLSGPLVVVFVPAYLLVAYFRRDRYFYIVSCTVLFLAMLQSLYLVGDPKSAVSQSFNLFNLVDIFKSLFVIVVPQYFLPKVVLSEFYGLILLMAICCSIFLINKKYRVDAFLLLIVFFSFIVSSLIKLYPNFHYIYGSRYLFYPYLSLTFYFLIIILRGSRKISLVFSPILIFVVYSHANLYQWDSLDYKWSEHIRYSKKHNCKVRVPIPYQGLEGVAWDFNYGNDNSQVCSSKSISNWLGGNSEKIEVLSESSIRASSKLKQSVFSLDKILVGNGESFVNFSLKFKSDFPYKHKIGIKYFDANDQVIKTVDERLDISVWPIFVSYIPKEAKYFRPFVKLNARETVEISDVSVLVL